MTYKKATVKAGRFFRNRIRVKAAKAVMIDEGLAPDDINHVATLLSARYRELKAALRARI